MTSKPKKYAVVLACGHHYDTTAINAHQVMAATFHKKTWGIMHDTYKEAVRSCERVNRDSCREYSVIALW